MASISKKIDENITQIETMFGNWSDIVERRFDLIKPITWEWRNKDTADLWEHIIS